MAATGGGIAPALAACVNALLLAKMPLLSISGDSDASPGSMPRVLGVPIGANLGELVNGDEPKGRKAEGPPTMLPLSSDRLGMIGTAELLDEAEEEKPLMARWREGLWQRTCNQERLDE